MALEGATYEEAKQFAESQKGKPITNTIYRNKKDGLYYTSLPILQIKDFEEVEF